MALGPIENCLGFNDDLPEPRRDDLIDDCTDIGEMYDELLQLFPNALVFFEESELLQEEGEDREFEEVSSSIVRNRRLALLALLNIVIGFTLGFSLSKHFEDISSYDQQSQSSKSINSKANSSINKPILDLSVQEQERRKRAQEKLDRPCGTSQIIASFKRGSAQKHTWDEGDAPLPIRIEKGSSLIVEFKSDRNDQLNREEMTKIILLNSGIEEEVDGETDDE